MDSFSVSSGMAEGCAPPPTMRMSWEMSLIRTDMSRSWFIKGVVAVMPTMSGFAAMMLERIISTS